VILFLLTGLSGCTWLSQIDGDSPCEEAGYAIARRTYQCTGDPDLSNDRHDLFLDATECIPLDFDETGVVISGPGAGLGVKAEDTYRCAFIISELAGEVVGELGIGIGAWLSVSNACAYVIEVK